ncbi:prepilin-type N-terminal cleavage/methylation domain-containing protein [Campylobacter lari]|nr:prepilin-type N-terminal cleavage/methylation domain-containing protein [Campylobacter lari]HEC1772553.1 type II secretion system protein [Campylobacter lari]
MKKAFSLLELALSIVILGILIAILSNPAIHLYNHSYKIKNSNTVFLNLNQTLLSMEKIYHSCLNATLTSSSFECYMSANDDIFYDLSLKKLNFSGIILENNESFFSPKSNLHFIENGSSKGILSNYKDMHSEKKLKIYANDYMYFYDIQNSKIYKALVSDREKIHFNSEKFSGFYTILYAYVRVYLENENIYMQIDDLNHNKRSFLLAQNISKLIFKQDDKTLKVLICDKSQNECLSKWMFL